LPPRAPDFRVSTIHSIYSDTSCSIVTAKFFTYEFLADWWGDCDGRVLDIVRGRVEDFPQTGALFNRC
jgi:hypothetical protein